MVLHVSKFVVCYSPEYPWKASWALHSLDRSKKRTACCLLVRQKILYITSWTHLFVLRDTIGDS